MHLLLKKDSETANLDTHQISYFITIPKKLQFNFLTQLWCLFCITLKCVLKGIKVRIYGKFATGITTGLLQKPHAPIPGIGGIQIWKQILTWGIIHT